MWDTSRIPDGNIEPWEMSEQREQYFARGFYVYNRGGNSGTEPTVKVGAYSISRHIHGSNQWYYKAGNCLPNLGVVCKSYVCDHVLRCGWPSNAWTSEHHLWVY